MMYWYGHGMGAGWGFAFMAVGLILFWGLVIAGIVLLFRILSRGGSSAAGPRANWPPAAGPAAGPAGPPRAPDPERLLAERFARGELDEDEYRRRLAVLRESGQATGAGTTS
jgi:putative membrane protein